MKIYLAGFSKGVGYNTDFGAKRILFSFVEMPSRYMRNKTISWLNRPPFDKLEVFLDSGAWSAFNSGDKVELWQYIDLIQKHGKRFSVIAALDDVKDPEKSMINYKDMLRAGIDNCIPTYHCGEPWEYLDKYCKMSDYIGIGGLVRGINQKTLILGFKRQLRSSMINKILERVPKSTKIHLFGFSDFFLVKKYADRIYSVDTTSWLAPGKFGSVITRSGKTFSYKGRQAKKNPLSWVRRNSYAARAFVQLEEDINNSLQKDLLKVVASKYSSNVTL